MSSAPETKRPRDSQHPLGKEADRELSWHYLAQSGKSAPSLEGRSRRQPAHLSGRHRVRVPP